MIVMENPRLSTDEIRLWLGESRNSLTVCPRRCPNEQPISERGFHGSGRFHLRSLGGNRPGVCRPPSSRGWKVFGASRRGTSSGGWTPIVMDVDSDASVENGIGAVLHEHHRLDAVIACAGWGLSGAVEETSIADARDQFETNFWGAVRVVQRALRCMRRQGHGRIVLISSIGGIVSLPFQAFYSASKFAMEGFGEALGYEVEPFNIGVTLVEPGNVRTEFTDKRRARWPAPQTIRTGCR